MKSIKLKKPVLTICMLLAGSPLLTQANEPAAATHTEGEAINVSVIELQAAKRPIYATLPGVVKSADEVQVASRFMGYIRKINVHEGEAVKKGTTLLLVDPIDVEGGIGQAKGAVASALAAMKDAERDFERFSKLYAEEAIPEAQFQKYKLAYDVAKAQYGAAKSALKTARGQLQYAEIKSPIDGIVTAKMTDLGQMAAPGNPLLVLQGSGHLQIEIQVDHQTYLPLKIGQEVKVAIEGVDYQPIFLTGKIERKVDAADPMSHTHLVKIGLGDDSLVAPGTYARVYIPVKDQVAITIPADALKIRAGIKGVFIVDDKHHAHFRMVRPGEARGSELVVLAGLESGDKLVIKSDHPLHNYSKVKVGGESQ
jgi:RND family efflux transporter MFP subunit